MEWNIIVGLVCTVLGVEASAKSAHHRIDHLEAVRDEEH